MVTVIRLERDKKVREVIVVPEIAHHPDSFLNVCNRLVICERPGASDGQHRRLAADLKTINTIVPGCVDALIDIDPWSGIALTPIGGRRTGAEAGRKRPSSGELLPLEVGCFASLIGKS